MSDIVYGPAIEINGVKPDWLDDSEVVGWSIGDGEFGYHGVTVKQYANCGSLSAISSIKLRADHPHYAQPSPADTVTIARMTEPQLHEAALAVAYDFRAGWRQAHRDLGLIREEGRAEKIARQTNLPLADVERVLAAIEETE